MKDKSNNNNRVRQVFDTAAQDFRDLPCPNNLVVASLIRDGTPRVISLAAGLLNSAIAVPLDVFISVTKKVYSLVVESSVMSISDHMVPLRDQARHAQVQDFARSFDNCVTITTTATAATTTRNVVRYGIVDQTMLVPFQVGGGPLDWFVDSVALGLTGIGFAYNTLLGLLKAPWEQLYEFFRLLLGLIATVLGTNNIFLNPRSPINFVIMGRVQATLGQCRREHVAIADNELPSLMNNADALRELWSNSEHFLKYAVAAYGPIQISANQVGDLAALADEQANEKTKQFIADYLNLPREDILYASKPGGDSELTNHVVAVDVKRQQVVFAIRGTYSVDGVNSDLEAETVDWCGGRAHRGFAKRADLLLQHADSMDAIELGLKRGSENCSTGYDLVFVGHSLGGGIAALLNIKCHQPKQHVSFKNAKEIKCYAYACPHCFTAANLSDYLYDNCFSYLHQDDCVPFLSINAGQRLFETMRKIDEITSSMNLADFWATALDLKPVSLHLRNIIKNGSKCLPDDVGRERLCVPFSRLLWLRAIPGHESTYDYNFVNPIALSNLSILVDFPEMLLDHFPPRYEKAISSVNQNLTS